MNQTKELYKPKTFVEAFCRTVCDHYDNIYFLFLQESHKGNKFITQLHPSEISGYIKLNLTTN